MLKQFDTQAAIDLYLIYDSDCMQDILCGNARRFAWQLLANNPLLWGTNGIENRPLLKLFTLHYAKIEPCPTP
ncbi:hypothetical protein [Bartonella sp. DGB2]|uniref:hypothetical protein n=1 Tax=Bartonella sp. DGB2 TaxID=3388426 RepID=UPI00398F94A6